MTQDRTNFKIDAYYEEIARINGEIKELTRQKKALEADVLENYKENFEELLRQKPEPFGKVSFMVGEYEVNYTRPKNVSWDQNKLAGLYEKIKQHENPDAYIKVKYDVQEVNFKNWPEVIRDAFIPARTIKNGTQKIEITKAD